MLLLKSTLSLSSWAPDRLAVHAPKDLPKIAKAAGWDSAILVDERTMAGALFFLIEAAKAKIKASVGIQMSRLRSPGGDMTLIAIPLDEPALKRLFSIADELARADTMMGAIGHFPRQDHVDTVLLMLPGREYANVPTGGKLMDECRSRGLNPAIGHVTVNVHPMKHAPRDSAAGFAEANGLPVVRAYEALTKERLDDMKTQALASFGEDAIAVRKLGIADRIPSIYPDSSVVPAATFMNGVDQATMNARGILARIQPMKAHRDPDLPRKIGLAPGEDADETLERIAREGLERKIVDGVISDEGEAWRRLEYELDVIRRLTFANYFLIMAEAIQWARARGIPVGPGRGSAAGSMVTYAMGITNIDPIKHKLIFERFLNPERMSLPDIDTDFCQLRRGEVLQHMADKYGRERFAQIATYATMKPKGAVRKAASLLKIPGAGNRAAEMMKVPKDQEDKALEKLAGSKDREIADIHTLASFLHGLAGAQGVHAGGVVVCDDPIREHGPLSPDLSDEGHYVLQYDMKATEASGYVKFDFLGLKTISVIDHAVKTLAKEQIFVDMDKIPTDDAPVYEMLSKGRTRTVFQLEGGGITRAAREVGITEFEDIVALVALYRPGPMANIPLYAQRKRGQAQVEYMHEVLKPILADTYGIFIYQEQIMQLARDYAGYSMPDADRLRKAVGKKVLADVQAERSIFVEKAAEMGRDPDVTENLFEFILPFASYGFNRSHAAAYATIAYQTAWLKKNYPGAWFAACATFEGDAAERSAIILEAAAWGFTILPPDVNESERGFAYVRRTGTGQEGIRLPMECVLNVGEAAAAEAIAEREANGPFRSFTDFTSRVAAFNRTQLANLVWGGVFDSLSKHPATVSRPHFADLAATTALLTQQSKASGSNQLDLLATNKSEVDPPPRAPQVTLEKASRDQERMLQGLLQHEKRDIGSVAWRRGVESLQPIVTASAMARRVPCATMGILKGFESRLVPGKTQEKVRVIEITVEDESGKRKFDVAPGCSPGPEVGDSIGMPVRLSLAPGTGMAFIGAQPEITEIEIYRDPLAEPREYPAVVLSTEIDEGTREHVRSLLKELSDRSELNPERAAFVGAARKLGPAKKRKRNSHLLLVPPSRRIEIFPMPAGAKDVDLASVMAEVPSLAAVLD